MTASKPRRRKSKATAREKAAAACAKHHRDLKRAHGNPPPDVKVHSRSTAPLISPVPEGSWCTSPAQLCAELGEQ